MDSIILHWLPPVAEPIVEAIEIAARFIMPNPMGSRTRSIGERRWDALVILRYFFAICRGAGPTGTCPMGQYSLRAAAIKSGDESQHCPHPRNDRLARSHVGRLPLDAVRVRAADDLQGHRIRN